MEKNSLKIWAVTLAICVLLVACSNNSNNSGTGALTDGGIDASGEYKPASPDVSELLKSAMEKNSDVVGWLYLPGTKIDEAVVQTTDNEFYLRRNVEKNYAFEGCYYLDYESLMFDDGKDLAQNSIIYGHNLGSPLGVRDDPGGAKFAQLFKLNDEETAVNTPYIFFVTPSETHVFEIFAVFYCEAMLKPIPYHLAQYQDEQLVVLSEEAKKRSTFIYDVNVNANDKLLTLSTCTYKYGTYSQNTNQRFVVMARLVRYGEKYVEKASLKINPNPKEPQF